MALHNDRLYLQHVRDYALEAIALLGPQPVEALREQRLLLLSLWKLIEIVGEASTRLSPEARATMNDIPWRLMIDMRNRINHGYDSIRSEIIWSTVATDLPSLVEKVEKWLASEDI